MLLIRVDGEDHLDARQRGGRTRLVEHLSCCWSVAGRSLTHAVLGRRRRHGPSTGRRRRRHDGGRLAARLHRHLPAAAADRHVARLHRRARATAKDLYTYDLCRQSSRWTAVYVPTYSGERPSQASTVANSPRAAACNAVTGHLPPPPETCPSPQKTIIADIFPYRVRAVVGTGAWLSGNCEDSNAVAGRHPTDGPF